MNLSEKIRSFPNKPGVYLMKDSRGRVVYVGKAQDIKERVLNYFGKGRDSRYQIDALMKNTSDIEYIVTSTEKEALLLEYNLIQEHKPLYNIFFKDNKRYVSIKISNYHDFPGIYVTRLTPEDGSAYFGPYTSAASCREVAELMTQYFKVRNCSNHFFANRSRPCIQYEIKRCTAPCVGYVSAADYKKQIQASVMFLKGDISGLINDLKKEMGEASSRTKYEEAAHLRDVIKKIKATIEPQSISGHGRTDKDYIGLYKEADICTFVVLELRQGNIKDYRDLHLKDHLGDISLLWEDFLLQYYRRSKDIPSEIFVDHETTPLEAVGSLISDIKGSSVRLRRPLKGLEAKRLSLAISNAKEMAKQRSGCPNWQKIVSTLAKKLSLPRGPTSIECVDISNISGKYAVGSMITFVEGRPEKNKYLRFNIRTKETPDDYAMMKEVLTRRFKRVSEPPDVLLIDGGKGHLMIAEDVVHNIGVKGLRLVAIAKGKERKLDQIFLPGRKNPVRFVKSDAAYLFLKRVRDEAHRFGISYYRKRHRKGLIASELDNVPGIGPAKRNALLRYFGSVEKLKHASVEDISKAPGISKPLAHLIISSFSSSAKTR